MSLGFSDLLKRLISERFESRRAFIRAAEPGQDENGAQGYLSRVIAGKKPAPLDRVASWADALGLDGPEREQFLRLAALTHVPKNYRDSLRPEGYQFRRDGTPLATGIVGRRARESSERILALGIGMPQAGPENKSKDQIIAELEATNRELREKLAQAEALLSAKNAEPTTKRRLGG